MREIKKDAWEGMDARVDGFDNPIKSVAAGGLATWPTRLADVQLHQPAPHPGLPRMPSKTTTDKRTSTQTMSTTFSVEGHRNLR